MKNPVRLILIAVFLCSLLLAACRAGGVSPKASSDQATANQPKDGLPGTEEFSMTKEELIKTVETVEGKISVCMRAAGFEYIAVDYATVRQAMNSDKSLPSLNDQQYVDQYGFGISTLFTGQYPQRADANSPATIGLGTENIRIFTNLSRSDQIAYNRALFGEYPDATFAVTLEMEDFSRISGCTRTAVEQTFSPEQLGAKFLKSQDALVEQDPRMIAALAQYSDCMRTAGFTYHRPNEPEPDIMKRLDAITGGISPDQLSASARSALTQLQGEERAIAAADLTCRVKIVEPVETQILRELYGAIQQ